MKDSDEKFRRDFWNGAANAVKGLIAFIALVFLVAGCFELAIWLGGGIE